MNRRGCTLTQRFSKICPAVSITDTAAVSIPFRRETEVGEPDFGVSHQRYLAHLFVGQREVEYLDIFRQPFDP
jgi:hypothetical protein